MSETQLYEDLRARLLLSALGQGLSIDEAIAAGERAIGWARNGTTLALLPAPKRAEPDEEIAVPRPKPRRGRQPKSVSAPESAAPPAKRGRASGWTPDEIARLRKLWDEGVGGDSIGKLLGNRKPAAIYAKARELKLPKRKTGGPRQRKSAPAVPAVAAAAPAPEPARVLSATEADVVRFLRSRDYQVLHRPGNTFSLDGKPYTLDQLFDKANGLRQQLGMPRFERPGAVPG